MEKQPFHSPATTTATALRSVTNRKMSYFTFWSEVSSIFFFFMHILHLSLPHVIFFPFNSCLAYFMPSGQFLSSTGRGIPAMYPSTGSNSRGVKSSVLSWCWSSCLPAQQGVPGPSALSQTCGSSKTVTLGGFGEQVNYLSFNWFTTHTHYCPLLQNSARSGCLCLPHITRQPLLPYH